MEYDCAPARTEEGHTHVALHGFVGRIHELDAYKRQAIDTETTSLDVMNAKLVGISLSIEPGHAAYIPLAHHSMEQSEQLPLQSVLDKLKPWLENPKKMCIRDRNEGAALAYFSECIVDLRSATMNDDGRCV